MSRGKGENPAGGNFLCGSHTYRWVRKAKATPVSIVPVSEKELEFAAWKQFTRMTNRQMLIAVLSLFVLQAQFVLPSPTDSRLVSKNN